MGRYNRSWNAAVRPMLMVALLCGLSSPASVFADCGCVPKWLKAAADIIGTGSGAGTITGQTAILDKDLLKIASEVVANSGGHKSNYQALLNDIKAFLANKQNAEAAAASQRRLQSQGFNPCPGRDVASAGASGAKASGQARKTLNEITAKIGEGKARSEEEAREIRRKVVFDGPLNDTDPKGHFLMPEDGLIRGEDVQAAQDMITLSTDPYPTPKVTDEKSRAGADAKLEQRIKQSRIAPSIDAMNAVKTFHDGSTRADLVQKYAQEAHIDASTVPVENGMTSMAAFYKLLAKEGRLLNSNWHQYVIDGQMDEAGLLKEMLALDAISLAMDYDNMESLNRFTLLVAMKTAIDAEMANLRVSGRMYAPGVAPVEASGH